MFIVYIAFGIISGIIAAAVALLSGSGFLTALLVYVLAGMVGMGLALVWGLSPKQSHTTKSAVTQRS